MHVTYVINGTDYGGAEMSLLRTAHAMRRRGHDVRVVSLKPTGPLGRELVDAGFPLRTLDMPERVAAADFVHGVLRLARVLREVRTDVVHAFLPRANVMSRMANRLAGRAPHVSGERSLHLLRSPLLTRANRATLRWTDRVVAVSPAVAEVLRARDRVPPDKLQVIVNGIDVDALGAVAPAALPAAFGAGPVVCSVGRLHPVKGHAHLLRALALLRDRLPGLRCLLVGAGPEAAPLAALAAALGVADRVQVLGFRRDAVAVMKACRALVLPSLEEGLPVTALEAMATGCPVIGSAVGGLRLAVEPGRTGELVPVGDAPALADAIVRVVGDPALAAAYAEAGRERVVDRFSIRRMVDETEQLYLELLA